MGVQGAMPDAGSGAVVVTGMVVVGTRVVTDTVVVAEWRAAT
jgi:hypothetical protein